MDFRYEAIPPAYEKTFEWVFQPPLDSSWSDFTQWLRSDEPLYWISGKPAAGKSTLMKFILNDSRTREYLNEWASGKKLVISSFYFWKSGAPVQMSAEGFARTLLYQTLKQTLKQAPELAASAFPYQFETYVMFGELSAWLNGWTWEELIQAFRSVLQQAGHSMKIFFFIDGLDEFNGKITELIDILQSLICPAVKICVSSRPWNQFCDGFRQRPGLQVEYLTQGDIKHCVRSRFRQNPGFVELLKLDPDGADRLITDIVAKSSGVFLWVTLVTNSLLDGLSDGEQIADLQTRLDSLPTDLEALFSNILLNLTKPQRTRTSQLMQIIRAAKSTLTLLNLFFADEGDAEAVLKMSIRPLDKEEQLARADMMKRRLHGNTKGLVESVSSLRTPLANAQVNFLHRTVKDYFEREDIWADLKAITDSAFCPYTRLSIMEVALLKIRSESLELKVSRGGGQKLEFWDHVLHLMDYAKMFKDHDSDLQWRLLNEFDRAASELYGYLRRKFKNNFLLAPHWSATRSNSVNSRSFYHLAIEFQLIDFIKRALSTPLSPEVKPHLNSLLLVAATVQTYKPPRSDIIETLLKAGANPDADINAPHGLPYSSTWILLSNSKRPREDICRLFLDYNADPRVWLKGENSIPEIDKLARHKKWKNRLSVLGVFHISGGSK